MVSRKVLIFAGYFLPHIGGYGQSIYELSKRLVKKGYEIDIVTCNIENVSIYEELEGIHIHRLPSWDIFGGVYPIPMPTLTTLKILWKLLRKKHDLINTQTRFMITSFLGLVFAKIKRIPLVHTERGTKHSVVLNEMVNLISKMYDHTIGSLIVKSAWKNIGVSSAACDFLRHLGAKETTTIHNGIDANFFRKKDNKLREELTLDDAMVVTFVGRLIYFNINRIKISLFLSGILQTRTLAAATLGIAILEDLLICGWIKRIFISKKLSTKSNIIIIGGGLFNKGAQAMTFTVVDQIKRRFPNKNIYLFSTSDFEREEEEKNIYKFNILPWDTIIKIQFLSFWGELFRKNGNCEHMKNHLRDVIENADFFIDISGYALSSQLGFLSSIGYLFDIIIAKKFSVPYYIFPQSIGPFDYRLMHKIFFYPLMKMYLKYPEKIFTREEEGLECLRKFTKRNSEKSFDIVLQNKGYNLNNIYNKEINFKDIRIEPNSVGVIPSLVVTERTSPYDLYSVYGSLIGRLIDAGKLVYILRHSYEDLLVCEEIKRLFPDNSSVRLIRDDLNAIELENIIKQFDFVIASRYHSIIHSYKNGVPALVIGWATKYFELLRDFCQLDYFFDVRNKIDTVEICSKLDKLIQNYKCEKEIITNKVSTLNKVNIFNIFGEEK